MLSKSTASSEVLINTEQYTTLMGLCSDPFNVDFNRLREAVSRIMEELQRLNGGNTQQIINLEFKLCDLLSQLLHAPLSESEFADLENKESVIIESYFNETIDLIKRSAALLKLQEPTGTFLQIYRDVMAFPLSKERQKSVVDWLVLKLENHKLPKRLFPKFIQAISPYLNNLDTAKNFKYFSRFEKLPQADLILPKLLGVFDMSILGAIKHLDYLASDTWDDNSSNSAKKYWDYIVEKLKNYNPLPELILQFIQAASTYMHQLIAVQRYQDVVICFDQLEKLPQAAVMMNDSRLIEIINELLPKVIDELNRLLSSEEETKRITIEILCNLLIKKLKTYRLSDEKLPELISVIDHYLKKLFPNKTLVYLDHLAHAVQSSDIISSTYSEEILKIKVIQASEELLNQANLNEKVIDSIFSTVIALANSLSLKEERIMAENAIRNAYIVSLMKLIIEGRTSLAGWGFDKQSPAYDSPAGFYRISEKIIYLISLLQDEDRVEMTKNFVDSISMYIFKHCCSQEIVSQAEACDDPYNAFEAAQQTIQLLKKNRVPEFVRIEIAKHVLKKHASNSINKVFSKIWEEQKIIVLGDGSLLQTTQPSNEIKERGAAILSEQASCKTIQKFSSAALIAQHGMNPLRSILKNKAANSANTKKVNFDPNIKVRNMGVIIEEFSDGEEVLNGKPTESIKCCL